MGGGGGSNKVEETDQQQALASVSMKRWSDYLDNYRPVENNYMRQVDAMNSDSQYQQAANMAAVPVEAQYSQAVNQSATGMLGSGINPNSGLFKAELEKLDRNKRSVKADMMNQGQMSQQNRYIGGLQNVAAIGQGQATTAIDGMGTISSMSAENAYNSANNAMRSTNETRGLVGSGLGMATSYGLSQYDKNSAGGQS